jgi:acyl-CoA thioesterase I
MKTGKRIKIVCLGDSTTAGTPGFLSPIEAPPEGTGDEKSQYAYWMAKSHPEWEVLNRGVNGERTDQILARFQRDVADEKPNWVIILGGVNDVFQGFPMEFAEHNLEEMYDRAARVGSMPVACTVLPYNLMSLGQARARRELNQWIKTRAIERAILFVDTAAAVSRKGDPDRLDGTPDGLHPDVNGYRKMAQAIKAVLDEQPQF